MSENAKIAAAQRLEEEKKQRDAPPELRNIFGVPLEDESSEDIVANPRRKLGRPASPAMSCATSNLAPGDTSRSKREKTLQHGRHFEVRWRYAHTHISNMSAGVSILVNKRMWKPRKVGTFDAPWKLQGRAGAIRLRNWQEDVAAIVMYWPPKLKDAARRAAYAETLYSFAEWLTKTPKDTPKQPQR